MAELGYFEPVPGIYGTANPATDSDPIARAALQERFAALAASFNQQPGYVPPGLGYGANADEWATQPGGPANLPIIGWTCQNSTGPAFREPYVATDMGHIPDWTSDNNGIAAGRYDMNQEVGGAFGPDRLNRAPIGDAVFQGLYGVPPNPNAPTEDVDSPGDLEW